MRDNGRFWERGERIDELEKDRNDPPVSHGTRHGIKYSSVARSFFFLTSPLPPLTEGRKHRDEPAVKMADSYVRDRATLRRQDVCV